MNARPGKAGLRHGPHQGALPLGTPPRAAALGTRSLVAAARGQRPPGGFQGGAVGSPTTLMTAVSCDRGLDHMKISRHAQPVAAASQIAFRRFLRAEMHDPAKAGNKKVALHLRRLEITEPWLPCCSVTFGPC